MTKTILFALIYSVVVFLISSISDDSGYIRVSGILLFVGLCAFINFLYEKINERLDEIEKKLNGDDQNKKPTVFRSKTPKK